MATFQTNNKIDSDALKANLLETAEHVEIRPDLQTAFGNSAEVSRDSLKP